LKERQEAEAKAKDEIWCKDKYVVIITNNTNLRSAPDKNATILVKANKGDSFKLLDRGTAWYEIFLPPDQNAFVNISLVDILTEEQVESRIRKEREHIQKEAEAKAQKLRLAAEQKERQLREAKDLKERQDAEAKSQAGK